MMKKILSIAIAAALSTSLFASYRVDAKNEITKEIEPQINLEEFSLTSDEIPLVIKELLQDNDGSDVIKIRDDNDIYSVTYEKENGEKFSKVFMEPIKYIDSTGKTQYIDTSIVKKEDISNGYEYRNASNDFLSEFSSDASIGIRLTKDANPVSMAVWNDADTDREMRPDKLISNGTELNLSDSNSKTFKNNEAEIGFLNDSNNDEFLYYGAFGENTIVRYTSTSRGIKEDIILEKNPGYNTFSFSLNTGDLIPVLIEDGQAIAIVAPNEEGDYKDISPESMVYYLSSIYVYDSYQLPEGVESDTSENPYRHYTTDCHYELEELEKGQYKLTSVISEEFLNDPRTVYPVTIDPSLSVSNTQTNINDTYITSAQPNTNYLNSSGLRIGNTSNPSYGNGAGKYYTYLRYYTLPALPSGHVIDTAYLKLKIVSGTTTAKNAKISHINSSWTGSALTYSGALPTIGSVIQSNVSHNSCSHYNFTVTTSVKNWYTGSSTGTNGNYGWRIEYSNASDDDLNQMYSSDCGVSANIPQLTINYTVATPTTPSIPPRTISDGRYYIKNLNSGKYLDVYNNGTANGTSVIQYDFKGDSNQQWKVTYESDGYYSLKPMHALSKSLDLYSQVAANVNGTDAQIYASGNYHEQKFLIQAASGGGYQIGTKVSEGSKVLEVTNSSLANNTVVQIWDYSTSRMNDNWVFETVKQARYCFTTTGPKMDILTPIHNNIRNMKYTLTYVNNSSTPAIERSTMGNQSIAVYHGHGDAGILWFDSTSPSSYLSSSDILSLPSGYLNQVELIAFLSCYSGTAPSGGSSLAQATYNRGAKVSIGFTVSVRRAENWFKYVTEGLIAGKTLTISMYEADDKFKAKEFGEMAGSPAYPANRVVLGNTNVTLKR